MLYDGDGRKNSKYTKDETMEKIARLVALPSTKWRPTVFGHPKTSRTNPKWERVPNLMGQKKKKKKKRQGWARYGR